MRNHADTGRGLVLATLLTTLLALGCDGTTQPSSRWSELTGTWEFSFVALDSTPCNPPVPQGCAGGGTIRFSGSGLDKRAAWTGGGGCQDCGSAADFIGGELADVTSSPTSIAFRYGGFRFDGTLPPGEIGVVTGTMMFDRAPGADWNGTWQMSRTVSLRVPARSAF